MLVGKTRRGAARLSAQLAAREVRKEYAAVVVGAVPRAGRVELPLSGQACATAFEPLRAARSVEHGTLTLVRLWPLTGRKHQLRRHMAALGHPILGDKSAPSPARALRLAPCELRPRTPAPPLRRSSARQRGRAGGRGQEVPWGAARRVRALPLGRNFPTLHWAI